MAKSYKTPGVYIEETPRFSPSIPGVSTAVPAFIGFTQKDSRDDHSLINVPTKISSMLEFERIFGKPKPQHISVLLDADQQLAAEVITDPLQFRLYYSLQLYFDNGGGSCYVCSAGIYPPVIAADEIFSALQKALASTATQADITLLVLADALLSGEDNFYALYRQALLQCNSLQNRFVIIDVFTQSAVESFSDLQESFRDKIGNEHLKYGAAYYPYLHTKYRPLVVETDEKIAIGDVIYKLAVPDDASADDLAFSLYHQNRALYDSIKTSLEHATLVMPPSGAVAGIYYNVDHSRGVWKAPANVSVNSVIKPMVSITNGEQDDMNVHLSGKSVNAIRSFPGKGTLLWGARTLAGNDNEWRYIPVQRLFLFVNESVKLAIQPFVFEPNDATTWLRVKAMLENFLMQLWRQGALAGAKPEQAYFVKVGLHYTMTVQDILDGRLRIELGLAPVRPAEFILTLFSIKMAGS
ncbi:MAG: phage tail sheath family protein [Chitinophagaceae bacterium]|nr:MAG: phage tail sheath family protein [Chitinophagaceae bacterium]